MKKLLFLIPFILISCSTNDQDTDSNNLTVSDLISSSWYINSYTLDGNVKSIDNCKAESKLKFTEDKIIKTWAYWRNMDGTNCQAFTNEIQYKLEGEDLLIENDGEIIYTVKVLDEKTITVSYMLNASFYYEIYKNFRS